MGSGAPRAAANRAAPRSPTRSSFRHSCAGRNPPQLSPAAHPPLPQFIPPPSRGEVRWGVGGREPPPPALHALITHVAPPPPSPRSLHHPRAPLRHSCAGRNHPTPPTSLKSCYAHSRTGVPNHAPLPTTPPPRPLPSFLRPLPSFLRRQEPNLAIADQNLTGVDTRLTALDTRLTKVDKGCQKLTPSTPAPTPNPSKTQQNRSHTHHPDTPSVNPRCQPLRRTPNNPEQIRTNLNKPEHCRTPRPDRETARITPDHLEKNKPRTPPRRRTRREDLAAARPTELPLRVSWGYEPLRRRFC